MSTTFTLDWIASQLDGSSENTSSSRPSTLSSQFGPLWPLIKAASILSDPIEAALLADVLSMDVTRLHPYLADLELLGAVTVSAEHHYCICPVIRPAAYAEIASRQRKVLHLRAAEALILRKPKGGEAAFRIAQHFEMAEHAQSAFDWWINAAREAIEDAAPDFATQYLERALSLSLASGSNIAAEGKLVALRLLGPLLAQLKGSGSHDVAAVYAHCLEIAEGLPGSGSHIEFDVLWGLNACILVHGRIETAGELSQRLIHAARAAGSDKQLLLATRLRGLARLLSGALAPALGDFRDVKQLCETTDYTPLRFSYASDQSAIARAHQAWAEAIAGELDASETSHMEALEQAERLEHPHTSAHVMCVLAARAQMLGLRSIAAPLANAARTVARRHKFAYWEAWAEIILGWHGAVRAVQTSGARIDRAILAYRETGAGQALPYAQHLRASVALSAGDFATAIAAADAGLAFSDAYGVLLFKAALLLDKAQATACDAERQLLISLAATVAGQQGAGLYEIRAASMRNNATACDTLALSSSPAWCQSRADALGKAFCAHAQKNRCVQNGVTRGEQSNLVG